MGESVDDSRILLRWLGETIDQVIEFYDGIGEASALVNSSWTARDALVHIVFWHESFARNVEALARGDKPTPLRGTYAQLAQRASDESADQPVTQLVERLSRAQRTIERSVLNPHVVLIPYKAGSRPYAPAEHLTVVNDHVSEHLRKVRLAYSSAEPRST